MLQKWPQGASRPKAMISRTSLYLAVLILTGELVACGGSSTSSGPPPPPPPPGPGSAVTVQAPTISLEIQGLSQGQAINVQAINGLSGAVTLSLQNLPAGVSTNPQFPIQINAGQSQFFSLQASSAATVGTSTVTVVGMSGSVTQSATFSLQLTPAASFQISLSPPSVSLNPGSTANILVTYSGSQLPSALFLNLPSSSALESVGLNLTELSQQPGPNQIALVLTATALAQPAQNFPLYISSQSNSAGQISQATLQVSVAPTLPAITALNRSTAVRTDMDVTGAVYDPARKLVFATAWQLNEVLVYSSTDATLKATIPVMLPLGIDETADGSKVYVGTFGPNLAVIDPNSLQVTGLVSAPTMNSTGCGPARIVTLSNGKAVVLDSCLLSEGFGSTATAAFLWDPVAGTFTSLQTSSFSQPQTITRSPSHDKALLTGSGPSTTEILLYDGATDTSVILTPSDGNQNLESAALSPDGSQIAMGSADQQGVSLYNDLLQLQSTVPIFEMLNRPASLLYSLDGKTIYALASVDGLPAAVALNSATLSLLGVAPDPAGSGFPYAIDETGMIFEGLDRGIEFFDVSDPGAIKLPFPFLPQPDSTAKTLLSLSSPTPFSIQGVGFSTTDKYQIYFGSPPASLSTLIGTTPVVIPEANAAGELTTTAPPGIIAGAANVTVTRSDGLTEIASDGATYGPQILAVDANAGPPGGGSHIVIYGYGLNGPGVQVAIGGSPATITQDTGPGFVSPFPFPMNILGVTTPPGSPGPADVTITTPAGATTITGGFHYLAAVNVYPLSGALNQIVYDKARQRLYVSNSSANVVDVFSLSSQTYLAPIPVGPVPLGITLTPDGSLLAVVNGGNGTVSVVNPSTATVVATYPVLTASDAGSQCQGQPWQIAPEGTKGMLVDVNCTALLDQGVIHTLDLSTGALGNLNLGSGSGLDEMASSSDASFVALADAAGTLSVLNVATGSIVHGGVSYADVAIDSGADRVVSGFTLYDPNLSFFSFPEETDYLGAGPNALTRLPGEKLNPSGSLLFVPQATVLPAPHPLTQGVDVFDVHRGRLSLRIALPDPVQDALNPMTLDETGTKIFLISNSGITVAQLQSAPLSIASVNPPAGAPGTQITIHGSGFTSNSAVSMGSVAVSSVFVDQNTLQVVVPSLPAGPVRISIANPIGAQYSFDAAFNVQ